MNTILRPSSISRAALFVSCCAVVVFAGINAIVQSQTQPQSAQPQPSPTRTQNQLRVATLQASDSNSGSRVALSSNQSLRDYEAYRRGDRFYVRIPAADIQKLVGLRGKAFADVTAQRTGDSTLVSFRLQPGAMAHVEPSANRLEIVIALPGDLAAATPAVGDHSGTSQQPFTNGQVDQLQAREFPRIRTNTSVPSTQSTGPLTAQVAQSSLDPNLASTPAQETRPDNSTVGVNQTTSTNATTTQTERGGFRERVRSWILLAQRNPIPVALAVAVLLLLIGFVFYQRKKKQPATVSETQPSDESAATKSLREPPTITAEASGLPNADLEEAAGGEQAGPERVAPPPPYQSTTEREVFEL